MRIRDRIVLGAVSGLAANAVKLLTAKTAMRLDWAELHGPLRAAGMLIPPHNVTQPKGLAVGYLADAVIAVVLGVLTVYMLSVTGKDRAVLKGAISGQVFWTALYGVLGTFGATNVRPELPETYLTAFLDHTLFGAVAATVASKLGHPDLFDGTIPLVPRRAPLMSRPGPRG
jgi:hypothetical protein